MKKVLITGVAGYIGSSLLPLLLENEEYHITGIDILMFGVEPLLPYFKYDRFTFVKGDVRDKEFIKPFVEEADIVIHLAAIVGYPACKKDPHLAESVNLGASEYISSLLKPHQQVIYASTGSNYGTVPEGEVCTEETPLNPQTLYGVTKTKAEKLFIENNGAVGFRFATAFGVAPRMRFDILINDFVFQAVHNRTLVLFEKTFMRTFIHVRDIARALMFAVEHYDKMKGQAFNVGTDENNFTKQQIAEMIHEQHDYYLHFAEFGTDADKRNYKVSYAKIRELGFECSISVEEGISELIKTVKAIDPRHPHSNLTAMYNC